jgi:hypothetical protein
MAEETALAIDITPGFGNLQSFELSQRAAKLLASSTLVPKEYQGNIPNCVIALNMASRMGADPLMVMQNLYIVHGRPGWSSQFLISTFNSCGRFTALRYEWSGEKGSDDYGCTAWCIEKLTGEKLEGSTVTMSIAKKEGWHDKSGSKWKTMPGQMLMYRAASWFIRAYAPELAMGMHTKEEIFDSNEFAGDYIETEARVVTDKPCGSSLEEEFKAAQEAGKEQEEPEATNTENGGGEDVSAEQGKLL